MKQASIDASTAKHIEELKWAKTDRRTAKSAFTRAGKTVVHSVESNRPTEEVSKALAKLQGAYENLVKKHEAYAQLIEEDEHYETEEKWLAECQEQSMKLEVDTKMFIDNLKQPKSKGLAGSFYGKGKILDSGMSEVDEIPNMQLTPGSNSDSEASSNNGMASMTSMTNMQPANTAQTTNDNDSVQTLVDTVVQITDPPTFVTTTPSRSNQSATCTFKLSMKNQNCLSLSEMYGSMQFSDRTSSTQLRPNIPKEMQSHCFARA